MKKIKKTKCFVVTMALSLTLGSIVASAATLMSYSGTGIWSKYSVSSFSLPYDNSTININHTTSSYTGGNTLDIKVCRKNILGIYSSKSSHSVSGSGSWTLTSSGLDSGTYKLLFERAASTGSFDISGNVTD